MHAQIRKFDVIKKLFNIFFMFFAVVLSNMILSFSNISEVPLELLKVQNPLFSNFPGDFAKVNEWKIVFDSCIHP